MKKNIFSPEENLSQMLIRQQQAPKKKELADELLALLDLLPKKRPQLGSPEYESYQKIQQQIAMLKEKIVQKHDEWMEFIQAEEKMSREFREKK